MIERLDQWIIDRLFQPLVDESGKKPSWWGRQFVMVYLVVVSVRDLIFGVGYWTVLCFIAAIAWIGVLAMGYDSLLRVNRWWRLIFLAPFLVRCFAIGAVLAADGTVPPNAWLNALGDSCWVSAVYVLACRPPRPRVPKPRLATQGGVRYEPR